MVITITKCILNKRLAPYFLQETISVMKNEYYSLSTDGLKDSNLEKMILFLTLFLNMFWTTRQSSGTAETIFSKTEWVIDYLEVPWENCVGFSLDNTGIRNSIKSPIIAKNEACYIMDCLCHNIHNAAHQGSRALTSATHFEIEDFCVDMFYHFDNRTTRKCALKIYYQFCDQEYRQILKNKNVRCLSLERAVECILKQNAGL